MSATTTLAPPGPAPAPGGPGARGSVSGVRPTVRAVAVEARRGGALALAAVIALSGVLALVTGPLAERGAWSITWVGAASWVSNALIFYGPLAAAAGAWAAGREGRGGTTEVLAATSRPAWQRVGATWAAVVLGALAGLGAVTAVVLVATAPSTYYGGGRWQVLLVLLALRLVAWATLGFVVGRVLRGRLVAPVVGLVGYLVTGWLAAALPRGVLDVVAALPPLDALVLPDTWRPTWETMALQTLWILAATATAVLWAAGRRAGAAVALVLLVLAGAGLVRADRVGEPDPVALQEVCTTDGGPQVCVVRAHAGLLDDVAPLARAQMARVGGVATWSSAREPVLLRPAPPGTLPLPSLDDRGRVLGGGLVDPQAYAREILSVLPQTYCDRALSPEESAAVDLDDAVAASLLGVEAEGTTPAAASLHDRLVRDPVAARAWTAEYLPASYGCDVTTLTALAQR